MTDACCSLPKPKDLTIDDIKREAALLSDCIIKDYGVLNDYLKRFELVIQKRWSKKNLKQRQDILTAAYPNIPRCHRPDFILSKTKTRCDCRGSRLCRPLFA